MTPLTTGDANPDTKAGRRSPLHRRRRDARRWPLVVILLIAVAVGVFLATRSKAHTYVLGDARRGTVRETVAVSGALQPTRSWNLYFSTSGAVATVEVSAGRHVDRGQVLARLKTAPLQAQVSSARAAATAAEAKQSADQAQLSAAEAKLDGDEAKQDARPARTSAQSTADSALITADQNGVTAGQTALIGDQAARTAAEQQLTAAQANLTAATLRAPAAATVAQVNVAAGQNIGGGGGGSTQAGSAGAGGASGAGSAVGATTNGSNAAITLEGGSLRAVGQVSDSQIAQVHVGQRALVTPAGQTSAISGRVESIAPTPTSTGGVTTYPVDIGWGGRRKRLFAGMSAQISILLAKTSGITVPSSAVHTSGTRTWVMVVRGARVRNGRARGGEVTRQPIDVGPSGGGLTIVRAGLRAGEPVILADNSAPLLSSSGGRQAGSGPRRQVRKLLG